MQFFADLTENRFLVSGLAAGLMASLASGIVGPYVVTRRLVFLAGAIAHIALGGIGASIYLAYRWPEVFGSMDPLWGATAASVGSAIVLAWLGQRAGERLDTVIGALWSAGMALGILLIKLTPGYHSELMSYLFGNLALVHSDHLRLLGLLDAIVVLVVVLFHKRFLAVCLDEEQARMQGYSVLATDTVLLVLIALTVITLTQVVGLILVIAMLSLPAATVARLTPRLIWVVVGSVGLCSLLVTVPRIAVYGSPISPEPAIVLSAVAVYLVSLVVPRVRSRRTAGETRSRPKIQRT
ncbi:MAG: metal ABC transporter permease [Thermoanaerobaculia bacterium]|nr:metal ABC transporter permease [Thermoanaerobaculia bacterium]